MKLPKIVVGTSHMGSVVPDALVSSRDRARAFELLDRLVEMGANAFDLAASYMVGGTERLFGAWIASRRNRDALFLVTKGAHPLPIVQPRRLDAASLESDLHASLARLRTEVVDLYLIHKDDPSARLEPVVSALERFVRAGKIRGWGVSNFSRDRLDAIITCARDAGLAPIGASSPHLSLFEWSKPPFPDVVSIAGERNCRAREAYAKGEVRVLAWSPLGSGFVATREGRGPRAYESSANRARLDRAARLASKRDVTAAQIALAYVLNQPFPSHAVVSASTAEKMRANLDAAKIELTPDEIAWLESG